MFFKYFLLSFNGEILDMQDSKSYAKEGGERIIANTLA